MNQRLARKIYGPWMERRTIHGVAAELERVPHAWVETDVLMTSPVVVQLDGAAIPSARPQQRCSSRHDGGGH